MPTTRSVKRQAISYAEEGDDDEEFASAKPVFLSDLYTPDNTTSTPAAASTSVTNKVRVKSEKVVCYECDRNLPKNGLELEAKLFLLSQLDMKGGPQKASTYKC